MCYIFYAQKTSQQSMEKLRDPALSMFNPTDVDLTLIWWV